MRTAILALVVVLCASAPARGSGQIGVVGAGDPLQKQVTSHIEKWLRQQGHKIVGAPLSRDAAATLANCFVIDDLKCARGVVDARTKAISLVFVSVEINGKTVTFTLYWFVKGHDPIGEKQSCEGCADKWQPLVEAVLQRLSDITKGEMGKLSVASEPTGLLVLLDDVKVGKTPVERDLPAGKHTVTLVHHGEQVASREVDISAGQTSSLSLNVDLDETGEVNRNSKLAPALLLAGGVVAAGAGVTMTYLGSRDEMERKWIYPALVPGGIVLCLVGGGAILGGGILLLKASLSRSAPVVSVGPGGAYLGWVSHF
jgi:hypothetical protein